MSVSTPLLDNTIEPDDSEDAKNIPSKPQSAKLPIVLSPTNRTSGSGVMATSQSDAESGTFSRTSSLCPIFNTVQIIRDSWDAPAVCASRCSILSISLPNGRCSGVYSVRLVHRQLCVIGMYISFVHTGFLKNLEQTVIVVVLLAMDFWNCRVCCMQYSKPRIHTLAKNVSGRILVGLRFWNQVCYAHSIRHAIHNPFPRSMTTARAIGCLRAVM